LDFLAKYESLRIHQKLISSRYIKDSKVKAVVHEFIKTHYQRRTWGQASVIRYLHNFYLDALAAVERDRVKSLSLN
jgi:hypothetical protein